MRQAIQWLLIILPDITTPLTQKAFVFQECFFALKQLNCLAKFSLLNCFGLLTSALVRALPLTVEGADGDGRVGGPWHPEGLVAALGTFEDGCVKVGWSDQRNNQTSYIFLMFGVKLAGFCLQQLHPLEFPRSSSRPGLRQVEKRSSSCSLRWQWAGRWRSRSVPV